MACQIMHWLVAGAGPSTLEHALVGIGCLLAYDGLRRWRGKGRAAVGKPVAAQVEPARRRAA